MQRLCYHPCTLPLKVSLFAGNLARATFPGAWAAAAGRGPQFSYQMPGGRAARWHEHLEPFSSAHAPPEPSEASPAANAKVQVQRFRGRLATRSSHLYAVTVSCSASLESNVTSVLGLRALE